MNITTAARRIAREHNKAVDRALGGNGKLCFGVDGSGGAWYSDNTYGLGNNTIIVPVRWQHITAREAQEILNEQDQ